MTPCHTCGQSLYDHRCPTCGQSVRVPQPDRTIAGFDGRGRVLYEPVTNPRDLCASTEISSQPRIIATAKSQDGEVTVKHFDTSHPFYGHEVA